MGLPQIEDLGRIVEESWRSTQYSLESLPDVARAGFARSRLLEDLTPDEIIRWTLQQRSLPEQSDPTARFGQPPITLYRTERFHIDALFWLDGTTTIHQHSFSGAFCVLAGSSIETMFRFSPERTFDGRFEMGILESFATSFHRAGYVGEIQSGRRMIHSLFHLERPSITVVIRNYSDPTAGVQFDYARPGIACDPFSFDASRDRAIRIVRMLRSMGHPDLERLVGDAVRDSDLHTAYLIGRELIGLRDQESLERILAHIDDSDAVDRFRLSFQKEGNERFIRSRRQIVKDVELRFFLGVLLNANNRREAFELATAWSNDAPPEKTIAKWLRGLSNVSARLQVDGSSWEPNVLGLPPIDDRLERDLALILSESGQNPEGSSRSVISRIRDNPSLECLWS